MTRPLHLLTLTIGLAAVVAVPASGAPPKPDRLLAESPGLIGAVALGRAEVAWSHCRLTAGPTRVWSTTLRRPKPRPIRGQSTPGVCDPGELIGVWGSTVVLRRPIPEGGTELVALNRNSGRVTTIDRDAPGSRIVAVDANGPRLVWLRETGSGATGETRTLLTHIGKLTPPRVLYTRTLLRDAVRPVDVWAGPSGQAVVREVLAGAIFGYALGTERAVLVDGRSDRPLQVVRLTGGNRVASADLTAKHLVYTVVRDGDQRVRLIDYVFETKRRRRVRLAKLLLPGMAPEAPAVPEPSISGSRVVWRERIAQRGRFRDRIAWVDLDAHRSGTVVASVDRGRHRTFLSQPALRGRRLVYVFTRFARPASAEGGFMGRSAVPARSRVVQVQLR
ncbi:MAG: hypothetical protein H6531_10145 [Actinobacteria bacterium]|nr:hypothetical protein [Actinomycetota bacterium]